MKKKLSGGKLFERTFLYSMYALLIIYCISLILPLIWMIFTACKGYIEYYDNKFLAPKQWVIDNFVWAFQNIRIDLDLNETTKEIITFYIWDMAGISLLYSTLSSFWNVLWLTAVSYVMAKYKFKGNELLYSIGLFVMITPFFGSSLSTMEIKKALGIYDNLFLHILVAPSKAFCGLHFMILYAAFKSISWAYAEAAFIDGASQIKVMLSIYFPMILPTCAVLFILQFLACWNDYGVFLIWLPSWPNLAYGMYNFQLNAELYGANTTQVVAGFAMVALPSSLLYLSFQKLITSKFTVGGLKG